MFVRVSLVLTIASSLFLFAACTSSGSVPGSLGSSGTLSSSTRSVMEVGTAASTAVPSPFAITAYGGLRGTSFETHLTGSTYDYSEIVTIDFNRAVNVSSFNENFTVTPVTPWTTYPVNYGQRIEVTLRKTPGVVYTFTMKAGLQATDGTALPAGATFHFTTPATVAIPARAHAPSGSPYQYGFLAHPESDSLSGPSAAKIADIMATAGAGFVRLDYPASAIMPTASTFNFTPMDTIVSLLASHKITVLPILEQYSTAPWQSEGQSYPAIFSTPQLYAQYVSAAVAHLHTEAPQITRVELFNEPNLTGWWTSPNPTYAATDGSATALYMLAGYRAAKAANPSITIVGPALADGGGNVDPRPFLQKMYASGCRTGTCWDVLSVHPYAWVDPTYTQLPSTENRWQIYQDLQSIAVANGDPKPHVMLTEWGFSTVDQALGFDPSVQARFMALGFNLMLADPTVDGIVWTSAYAPGSDFWSRTAITDASFAALPGAQTFHSFAAP
jgi:hypothetical protein